MKFVLIFILELSVIAAFFLACMAMAFL